VNRLPTGLEPVLPIALGFVFFEALLTTKLPESVEEL
jgi:hypothetical protein